MLLQTQIEGYKLVNLREFEDALHKLQAVSVYMDNVRNALLRDVKILQEQDRDTMAKSIRLLIKLEKMMSEVEGIKL